jgi:hypothetical protein
MSLEGSRRMASAGPSTCSAPRRARRVTEQRLLNTLWIVIPALLAVAMNRHGSGVEVVERNLSAPPVVLATDHQPASASGFFWEVRSTAQQRLYRSHDGRAVRVTARPGEMLLWCRQVGEVVYSLAGQGPDRAGPPCLVDPPFVLRRTLLRGGPTQTVCADLPSPSVFVTPSQAICYADRDGVYRVPPEGGAAELLCPRTDRNITAWGQRGGRRGETLYWIEEAMPGGRDPVSSCRVMALDPDNQEPRTLAWAPDALTDLVVDDQAIAWYHPAGRALEGVEPDGRVTVLARDINLAATPVPVGDRLFYLCERSGGARDLAATVVSRGGRVTLAHLDRSACILGSARDGLYLSEEEGGRGWFSSPVRTGRLLRVPLR